jgi:hypothetical protein
MTLESVITAHLTANPSATAEEVLTHVNGYVMSRIVKADTNNTKVGISTVDSFNDTSDRLASYDATGTPGWSEVQVAQANNIARKIYLAFTRLFNVQYHINFNVPEVDGMFMYAVSIGIITQVEYDGILAAVTVTETPHLNTTLTQVKAVMTPGVVRDVDIHYGNNQLVMTDGTVLSAKETGFFRFIIDPQENFKGRIKINMKAKKAGEVVFSTFPQLALFIEGDFIQDQPVTYTFNRSQQLTNYRHFTFTFEEPYLNACNTLNVEAL